MSSIKNTTPDLSHTQTMKKWPDIANKTESSSSRKMPTKSLLHYTSMTKDYRCL